MTTNTNDQASEVCGPVFPDVHAELAATRALLRDAVAKLNRQQRKALVTERVATVRHWTKMEKSDVRAAWLPTHEANLALAMEVIGRPETL